MTENNSALVIIPGNAVTKQTVSEGPDDGIYTVNAREIDPVAVAVVIIAAVCSVGLGFLMCPTAIEKAKSGVSILLSFAASGAFIRFWFWSEESNRVKHINGHSYRYWLHDTHDLVYRVTIQVSEWSNSDTSGNVISFYRRRITAYNDTIEVLIHCPWAAKTRKNINDLPIAITDDADEYRRALEMTKALLKMPKLTGKVLMMSYEGQRLKKLRWDIQKCET